MLVKQGYISSLKQSYTKKWAQKVPNWKNITKSQKSNGQAKVQGKIKVYAIVSRGTNRNPILNIPNRFHSWHIHEEKKNLVKELFIHSFNSQIFTGCLLCIRYTSEHRERMFNNIYTFLPLFKHTIKLRTQIINRGEENTRNFHAVISFILKLKTWSMVTVRCGKTSLSWWYLSETKIIKSYLWKYVGKVHSLIWLQLVQKTLWQKSVSLFLEEKGVNTLEDTSEWEEKE